MIDFIITIVIIFVCASLAACFFFGSWLVWLGVKATLNRNRNRDF